MWKRFILGLCIIIFSLVAQAQNNYKWQQQPSLIATRWASNVNPKNVLPEYPRPQLERKNWINLNGLWDYAITELGTTGPEKFNGQILVPFPIESSLSGVKRSVKPSENIWYKRKFDKPQTKNRERIILHFDAIDFEATIFLNGQELGSHRGGYQRFSFDVTNRVKTGANELLIKVWDPSDMGPNPHGKQVLEPQGIMYTPSSGIWQAVWMEVVPDSYIKALRITPDIDKENIAVEVNIGSGQKAYTDGFSNDFNKHDNLSEYSVNIQVMDGKKLISRIASSVGVAAIVPVKNPRLWSPDDPFLYSLKLQLVKNGKVIEEVMSYFGMRKVEIKKDEKGFDRIFLNNQYTYNLGVLDQGFWPDGLYTAPTDEALAFDIKAVKAMGFNTIRKHIKIEPERWYYHTDKLGMLVWQDMVNPGSDTKEGRTQFEKENKENIAQLYNHPSIITWVLFNEKWGQYDQQRLTKELKQLDPSRLINGHSGEMLYVNDQLRSPSPDAWVNADMTDVHAYPMPGYLQRQDGKAMVIGEFGGIGVPVEGHLWNDLVAGWGYDGIVTPTLMRKQYTAMVDSLKVLESQGLTASIYTQPFDVESEQNGLMTYDRAVIKLPADVFRGINSRIWSETKNYIFAIRGFSATVADTLNKDYAASIREFESGKRDSAFLRRLTLVAIKYKDESNLARISAAYMAELKMPLADRNIDFMQVVTNRTSDAGYKFLWQWVKQNIREGDRNAITGKLQEIIFREQVKPILTEHPDWNRIEKIISDIKPLDGELVRGLSVVYYLNALQANQPNAIQNLVDAATRYDSLYDDGAYNSWAWLLFQKSTNSNHLTQALKWSRKSIEKDPNSGNLLDTYANLLYKLGRKDEALQWEQKAIQMSPNDPELRTAYEKMQRNEKTW